MTSLTLKLETIKQLNVKFTTLLFLSIYCICVAFAMPVKAQNALQNNVKSAGHKAEYEAFNVSVIGSGQPILLIPGVSSSAAVWQDTIEHFSGDYQLHAFSLAGFAGVKPAPPAAVGRSFLEYQKKSVLDYIRANNLKDVVIIGHSLGGTLALWLATEKHPEISAIINIDGLPALGALFGAQKSSSSNTSSSESSRSFDPKSMVKSMANNEAWHGKMINEMMTSDPMTSGRAFGELMQLDIRDKLNQIERPVLTIGAPAQAAPYSSYEATKNNYVSQMANVPDEFKHMAYAKSSKHFIMADEPEWMISQIESFLKSK